MQFMNPIIKDPKQLCLDLLRAESEEQVTARAEVLRKDWIEPTIKFCEGFLE